LNADLTAEDRLAGFKSSKYESDLRAKRPSRKLFSWFTNTS